METPIRVYSKSELASLYFPYIQPASARRNLRNWIAKNDEMRKALIGAGYTDKAILLTPTQVRIFFDFLGEP